MGGNKRTLLMTADTLGGVWSYSLDLITELTRRGYEVHLATMGRTLSADQLLELTELERVTLHESAYKLEWMQDPWRDLATAATWLLELDQEIKPDMIHLNHLVHGDLPWTAPVLTVVHSCVVSWWQGVKQEPAPPEWDYYRQRVQHSLRHSTLVVAPSEWMRDEIFRHYQLPVSPQVIYNGRAWRLRIASKRERVFGMGRLWDEGKNLAILARAAERLTWRVYLAGDARDPSTSEVIVLENVTSLGLISKEQVTKELAQSSIFVLPSLYEPFGLSALEAAASGCALVLSDTPSLREIWQDAALYFDPRNAHSLADAVNRVIHSTELRVDLALRASARAREFTAARMADEYVRCYDKLLAPVGASSVSQNLPTLF